LTRSTSKTSLRDLGEEAQSASSVCWTGSGCRLGFDANAAVVDGVVEVGAIAAAHRATLTAQPRPHGGLTVAVTFPSTSLDAKRIDATTRRPALETSGAAQTRA
jgi:hypothetical protein